MAKILGFKILFILTLETPFIKKVKILNFFSKVKGKLGFGKGILRLKNKILFMLIILFVGVRFLVY